MAKSAATKKTAKKSVKKISSTSASAKANKAAVGQVLTADEFIKRVKAMQSDEELRKIQRYFKTGEGEYGEGDVFIGVRMGHLFNLAKEFIAMPLKEIAALLDNPIHEVRAGAMSIMDKQGRNNKLDESQRKALYDLYMRKHDRINNWDLVDLGAQYVVGRYLVNQKRDILYKLVRSKNIWERRTAIVSTAYLIRQKQVEDTFALAEILVKEKEDLIHKSTGWMLRFAGDVNPKALAAFLEKHAATMPRTMLRASIEKLGTKQKEHYMNKKNL